MQQPEPGGLLDRIGQQGMLADAGLAANHQHATLPSTGPLQQGTNLGMLLGPSIQHERFPTGHKPASATEPRE
jgi:hypothetical protein